MDFRKIDAHNIDQVSQLYEAYAGVPLHKDGILRSGQNLPTWSVWEGSEPIGFYYTLRFAPDILKLVHIFVATQQRRQGMGSAMLKQLFDIMPSPFQGVIASNSALFQPRESKVDPEAFYLRNGFSLVARTPDSKVFWKSRLTDIS